MAPMLISDSEWEIMRIIWEKAPVTSSVLIAELEATKGWMPTTVKTFLARLVKKEIIQFERAGRGFVYSPLVTEERCVRDELQAVIERVYGGAISAQTQHFVFKGARDQDYVNALAELLEANYQLITSDLEIQLEEAVPVYVHATQSRLHSALGVMGGPSWLRAGQIWGMLHLAPRACFDEPSAERAALHTFVLLLIQRINPSVPYWLQQAVATYYAGWMTKERIEAAHIDYKEIPRLLSEYNTLSSYIDFKEIHGYEWGYTVVDYIVQHHGKQALAALLRRPADVQECLLGACSFVTFNVQPAE